jgi:hypothetical protein
MSYINYNSVLLVIIDNSLLFFLKEGVPCARCVESPFVSSS